MSRGVAGFACTANSSAVRPVRQLAFAVVVGAGLGALTVGALGGPGERDDAEIANEVMAAGDLTTWQSAPGEVCMRWGDRFLSMLGVSGTTIPRKNRSDPATTLHSTTVVAMLRAYSRWGPH